MALHMLLCAITLGLVRSALGLGVWPAQSSAPGSEHPPAGARQSRMDDEELIAGGKDADEDDDFDTWYFEHAGGEVLTETPPAAGPEYHRATSQENWVVAHASQQCRLPATDQPKLEEGVIVFLVTRPMDLIRLEQGAPRLRYHFLRHWPYPVKIFVPSHELRKYDSDSYFDSPTFETVHRIMTEHGGKGYAWNIETFNLNYPKVIRDDPAWKGKMNSCAKAVATSYKHMNQFFTKTMYEHPSLKKYRYYLRIDADFNFVTDVAEDPFCMMAKTGRKFMWETRKEIMDTSCSDGLWEWFLQYQTTHGLIPQDPIFWKPSGARVNYVGYAGMGDLAFFRSDRVRTLAKALNEDGRIYLNRWSDQTYYPLLFALFENHTKVGDVGFGWPKQSWCHKCKIPPAPFNPMTGKMEIPDKRNSRITGKGKIR